MKLRDTLDNIKIKLDSIKLIDTTTASLGLEVGSYYLVKWVSSNRNIESTLKYVGMSGPTPTPKYSDKNVYYLFTEKTDRDNYINELRFKAKEANKSWLVLKKC